MPYYPDSNGGKRYMGDSVEMDGEQIDELKKTTLMSYKEKNWKSTADAYNKGDDKKVSNRLKGMALASRKLAAAAPLPMRKEEVDQVKQRGIKQQMLVSSILTRVQGFLHDNKRSVDPKQFITDLQKKLDTLKSSGLKEEVEQVDEAVYQGKKVPLNKPMAGDVKKSKVYVDPDGDGTAQKVNFGDKNMTIKKHIPGRRKNFRARHNCENPGPKTKARYWSCKAW
jgi:hypothetical protein